MKSSASHPAGPHDRLAQKTVNRAGRFDTICTSVCDHCDSSTVCRLCRLEPLFVPPYRIHTTSLPPPYRLPTASLPPPYRLPTASLPPVEEMMCVVCVYLLQRGHSGDGCDLTSTLCKCVNIFFYRKKKNLQTKLI